MSHDIVLIVDFGTQVTQLIARRVREAGVYCEIHPFSKAARSVRADEAQGGDPVGRPGVGPGAGQPARAGGDLRERRADPGHLLWPADACASSSAARSRAAMRREFGRADVEILEALRAVRRRVGVGRALSGLDEPWRPRDPPAGRFPRRCGVGERALRRRRRRGAPLLHHACSIPRSSTRPTARS